MVMQMRRCSKEALSYCTWRGQRTDVEDKRGWVVRVLEQLGQQIALIPPAAWTWSITIQSLTDKWASSS